MTLPTHSILRSVAACAAAVLALCALSAAAPAASLAASRSCAARPHTVAARSGGKVWHSGASLFGCTTAYGPSLGHTPRTRRLGPWTPGTKVAFDGVTAVWSVPKAAGDRVWADNLDSGEHWLTGTRIVPGSAGGHFTDGRVQRLMLTTEGAAWITRDSQVVLALHEPASDPTPFGALAAPLSADKQLLLVGSFPGVAASTLAQSATLEVVGGDGDECGGVDTYRLSVAPDPSGPRIGADWDGDWEVAHCG
jgi:hypothetical protein